MTVLYPNHKKNWESQHDCVINKIKKKLELQHDHIISK